MRALVPSVVGLLSETYGLGAVRSCVPVRQGLMNPNWRLESDAGAFAVKRLRDAGPEATRRQHRVLPLLAERGVPVPVVRTARDGDTVAEIGGDFYAVSGWLPGVHRSGPELGLPSCRRLGSLLGQIHVGLRELLPHLPLPPDPPPQVAGTVTELDRIAGLAEAGRGDFDAFAVGEIARRRRLLHEVAHLRPPDDAPVGPAGWTHGDINDLNLLFRGESVCGVLDWDRLGVRTYGLEVVRTATLMFGTGDERGADLPRIAAFVAGYRGRMAISDDALRDAAHRRWWRLVTDTWFLRLHYDEGNASCDHLLRRSGIMLRWWTGHRDALDAALLGRRSP